tara:strand:- start:3638 stop:4033 length:396 start_codon:yes stop_codon:yes gene_type:complete
MNHYFCFYIKYYQFYMDKLFITFLIGGLVVSSVSYLSNFVSNYYASILWAFPFTVLPTIYYLKHEGKSNLYISDFLIKTSISILILVGVLATMSYAVRYYSINTTILFSFVVYIILSLLFIRFIKINEPKG